MLLTAIICVAIAAGFGIALAAGLTHPALRAVHASLGVTALVLVLLLAVGDAQWRTRGLAAGALLLATASGSKLFHRRIKGMGSPTWARVAHAALGLLGLVGLGLLAQP